MNGYRIATFLHATLDVAPLSACMGGRFLLYGSICQCTHTHYVMEIAWATL
eukprot:m.386675 g.386675  ORF g.386675 m.386675 type:complete len:51 (+) comp21019_c0_seq2:2155-2307(+)